MFHGWRVPASTGAAFWPGLTWTLGCGFRFFACESESWPAERE